ncbi:hypothetical protein D5018_10855 [Parashewanella curva]|uniref:Uncharacterized protein n=1 Tax=Parashewanella curva TaxID=2338552 RepID=A0A3L8PWA9_9GAMM|nr:hypothetical protein [Parashewanella curva]RLV59645.1 hypothetical protein D5018_10855 [Parashewanella curva]
MASPTSPSQQAGPSWGNLPFSPPPHRQGRLASYQLERVTTSPECLFQREQSLPSHFSSRTLVQFKKKKGEALGVFYKPASIHAQNPCAKESKLQALRYSRRHRDDARSLEETPFALGSINPKKRRKPSETMSVVPTISPRKLEQLDDTNSLSEIDYQTRVQMYHADISATREAIREEVIAQAARKVKTKNKSEYIQRLDLMSKYLKETGQREDYVKALYQRLPKSSTT